jgi:hypothetical protein
VGNGERGNLTIILPGGERAIAPEILDNLVYAVTFSGSSGERRDITTAPGEAYVTLTLGRGGWTVQADAYLGGVLFGSGGTSFRITDSSAQSVHITMSSFYLTGIDAVTGALASAVAEDPSAGSDADHAIPLAVSLDLADASEGWVALREAIATKAKYVALDLSASAMDGTEFAPHAAAPSGEGLIVSLVLPNRAKSIAAGDSGEPTFERFTALKSIVGGAVTSIGEYAFTSCPGLVSVSLPKAETIGTQAFDSCYSLNSVSLPEAETIGAQAFGGCYSLNSISLPEATYIGSGAFGGCYSLNSVSLPEATYIGNRAFEYTETTASLTVTLGGTPPELGTSMFGDVNFAKLVIVKVPDNDAWSGLISGSPYDQDTAPFDGNWGNAFRGGGWDGTYLTGTVNTNITLKIEPLP